MPLRNINEIYEEADGKICKLLEILNDEFRFLEFNEANMLRVKVETEKLIAVLDQHEEDIKAYCKKLNLELDRDVVRVLDVVKASLVEITFLFQKSDFDHADWGKVNDKIACILGYWEERYTDYLGCWQFSLAEERLEKVRAELAHEPSARLIFEKLCPNRVYLRENSLKSADFEDSETYTRSEKHPFIKNLGNKSHLLYNDKLENGGQAHVGNYGNIIQMLGDDANAHFYYGATEIIYKLLETFNDKLQGLELNEENELFVKVETEKIIAVLDRHEEDIRAYCKKLNLELAQDVACVLDIVKARLAAISSLFQKSDFDHDDWEKVKGKITDSLGYWEHRYIDYLGCWLSSNVEGHITEEDKEKKHTAEVYEAIIKYKNYLCNYISDKLKDKTSFIKAGFYNNYPCLMVFITNESIFSAAETKLPSDNAFEEWVNFLISYYVGLVNFSAYSSNIPIEMERRSSFGFLIPSISPCGKSMRISIGLIPQAYADIIANNLVRLDDLLKALKVSISKDIYLLPNNIFYYSAQYKKYLDRKYPIINITHPLQLLWAQIEKNGKTTLQNAMRTAFARDGISAIVFNKLLEGVNDESTFMSCLSWILNRISVQAKGKRLTLTFNQECTVEYKGFFFDRPIYLSDDRCFWQTIEQIISNIDIQDDLRVSEVLYEINNLLHKKDINNLHSTLEVLNELIFAYAIKTKAQGENVEENGYGSDSETEAEYNSATIYSKKIIVHNGMRAILASITAISDMAQGKVSLYLGNVYYEIPYGIEIIKKLNNCPNLSITKEAIYANVLLLDLNACVTSGKQYANPLDINSKIVILDITSAIAEDVNKHIKRFTESRSPVLFLVDSGFKHQQLGADKNQYGTIRIITRNKSVREQYYHGIISKEPRIRAAVSHRHRRLMKKFKAVPTTNFFFNSARRVSEKEAKTISSSVNSMI